MDVTTQTSIAISIANPPLPLAEDASIISLVDTLLTLAIQQNASDIHCEPYEKTYRIRMRVDGLLYEKYNYVLSIANRIATRIKVMANLDISERRIPQDGRFKFTAINDNNIDCRVSTCPTIFGEKIVIRFLNSQTKCYKIDDLGFEPKQLQLVLKTLQRPQGMILVTGPTGSGKTATLYSALDVLNTTENNILTAEDPVEIFLPGINQVNINNKIGVNFKTILRAFLRQDPDIIMIGEIRDKETAEIAMNAAQTGHLVLATLHTNNAAESLLRLNQIGIPNYHIATAVSLVIAQRLVRKLCTYCKQQNNKKCDRCLSGYAGRTGIFEVLHVSESLKHAITNSLFDQINPIACSEGMLSLQQAGMLKVKQGITNHEEIHRVHG